MSQLRISRKTRLLAEQITTYIIEERMPHIM